MPGAVNYITLMQPDSAATSTYRIELFNQNEGLGPMQQYQPPSGNGDFMLFVLGWKGRHDITDYPFFRFLAESNELTYSGDPFEDRFRGLMEEWREATRYSSSATDITNHRAYFQIIGMGHEVVPLILRELRQRLDHWFWALLVLTGENPVAPEDAGNLEKMREAWLHWADSEELMHKNGG